MVQTGSHTRTTPTTTTSTSRPVQSCTSTRLLFFHNLKSLTFSTAGLVDMARRPNPRPDLDHNRLDSFHSGLAVLPKTDPTARERPFRPRETRPYIRGARETDGGRGGRHGR